MTDWSGLWPVEATVRLLVEGPSGPVIGLEVTFPDKTKLVFPQTSFLPLPMDVLKPGLVYQVTLEYHKNRTLKLIRVGGEVFRKV